MSFTILISNLWYSFIYFRIQSLSLFNMFQFYTSLALLLEPCVWDNERRFHWIFTKRVSSTKWWNVKRIKHQVMLSLWTTLRNWNSLWSTVDYSQIAHSDTRNSVKRVWNNSLFIIFITLHVSFVSVWK